MNDPKSIVRELVDAYNAKSVDRLVALYHPDGRLWSPFERDGTVGHAAIGASIRRLFETYPEEQMTVELLAADDTHAVAEFRSVGLGPSRGEVRFTEVYEMRDGRIATCHVYIDPEELPA
jgi:hypothetical protein